LRRTRSWQDEIHPVRATVRLAVKSPPRREARDALVFDRDVAQELQALGLFAESGAGNVGASVR